MLSLILNYSASLSFHSVFLPSLTKASQQSQIRSICCRVIVLETKFGKRNNPIMENDIEPPDSFPLFT